MKFFATIGNGDKSQRALSDALTTNYLWKFAEQVLPNTSGSQIQQKKLFKQYLNIEWLSARINKFPAHIN